MSPVPKTPPSGRRLPLDSDVRRRIVEAGKVTMVVDAGAGTGKTTVLLDRLVRLLVEGGLSLSRVAAITFTEKAAADLASRLRARLEKAWKDQPDKRSLVKDVLRDLEQAQVSTIHAFCMRLLKEYPVQAGLDPQFEVLDEVQAEAAEVRSWEEWLGRALQKEAPELVGALRCGVRMGQVEALKSFLLWNRTLLKHPQPVPPAPDPGPCRDAFLRSAGAVREAVRDAGFTDRLTETADDILKTLPELEAADARDLPFVLARMRLKAYKDLGSKDRWGANLAPARAAVYPVREALWDFQERLADHILRGLERWLWGYLEASGTEKFRSGVLSYDDLLLRTRDLLNDHPDVREALSRRFQLVFVDEFQDTDPLQAEIVFLLCGKEGGSPHSLEKGKLFVVGDPKQSIYRFRRADVAQYLSVRETVKGSPGGAVELLPVNFRTVPAILKWVNGCFAHLMDPSGSPYAPLLPHREAGPVGAVTPLRGLKVAAPADEALNPREAEARAVAASVDRLLKEAPLVFDEKKGLWDPLRAGDVAVLFRNLAGHEEVYEDAFRRLGVPFTVVGGRKFYRRPEVTALAALLSSLEAPAEEALCVAVLRSFLFGFSDEELFLLRSRGRVFRFLSSFEPAGALEDRLKKAFDLMGRLHRRMAPLGLPEAIGAVFEGTDLLVVTAAQPHGEQRVANLLKIRDLAASLEDGEYSTLRGFVAWLKDRQESESDEEQAPGADEGEGAVKCMTIHQSKGLEFPVVFLAGFQQRVGEGSRLVDRSCGVAEFAFSSARIGTRGLEGLKDSEKSESSREDLRLLYVACTRARDGLVIPFPVPLKKEHVLAGLCEGWEEASRTAPCEWKVPTGGGVLFDLPPPFPEESSDREAFAVALDGDGIPPEAVIDAEKTFEEREKTWARRVTALAQIPGAVTAHEAGAALLLPGDEAESWSEGDGRGLRLGSLVHRLMELAATGGSELIPQAARTWGAESFLKPGDIREALAMALQAAGSGFLRRAASSGRVFCEAAASCRRPDGSWLEGVMDLAFLEEEGWVVADYKTDRDPERFREKYEAQLKAYAELLEASTGIPVKEAVLYFLRSGDVRSVPFL